MRSTVRPITTPSVLLKVSVPRGRVACQTCVSVVTQRQSVSDDCSHPSGFMTVRQSPGGRGYRRRDRRAHHTDSVSKSASLYREHGLAPASRACERRAGRWSRSGCSARTWLPSSTRATTRLLGPWDSNPDTINGRVHAAVFSKDGNTLYLANEGANEVDAIDPRTGYVLLADAGPTRYTNSSSPTTANARIVSRRGDNKVALIDLENQTTLKTVLTLGLPDTMQLSANEKLLTIGLRTSPAQLAVVNTKTTSATSSSIWPDPARRPAISGRRQVAESRSRRLKEGPIPALRSSTIDGNRVLPLLRVVLRRPRPEGRSAAGRRERG